MSLAEQLFMIGSCQVQKGIPSPFGMIFGILVYPNGNISSSALLHVILSFLSVSIRNGRLAGKTCIAPATLSLRQRRSSKVLNNVGHAP